VGPTCQPGPERAKAARGETFSRVVGGNPAGRHRRAVGWAERARPSGEGRGENGRLKRKKMARGWAERPDGPKVKEKFLSE
jgi:hypothetical protein